MKGTLLDHKHIHPYIFVYIYVHMDVFVCIHIHTFFSLFLGNSESVEEMRWIQITIRQEKL